MSDSDNVREFTAGAGQPTPNKPELMSKKEVFFLVKMILDEMMELCATVEDSNNTKLELIKMIVDSRSLKHNTELTEDERIGEQADALIDSYYYSLNAAAKKGINLSKIFKVVHAANMAKRDKKTGEFLKRDDGKIIKPDGWTGPDITAEITRQSIDGAFE